MPDKAVKPAPGARLIPLPPQRGAVSFPTHDWPVGEPPGMDKPALEALLDEAFSPAGRDACGETHAVVVIAGGLLAAERYAPPYGADATLPSWSMAKSITQALVGIAVRDGHLDIFAPAPVPEWQAADDPRRAITLDQLLRMSSGLAFEENYEDERESSVITMLFGAGKPDMGAFAANFPLIHEPGAVWSYSSGTTNIITRCLQHTWELKGAEFEAFMQRQLFVPLGMTSPVPKFDGAGTFIGSSYCFCTARDFARFGLLYLRDGVWEGQRLLPRGWVDYARTPGARTPDDEPLGYGAHWWLGLAGADSFCATGYQGQFIIVVPDRDLVLVRNGKSTGDNYEVPLTDWFNRVAACFPKTSPAA